MHYLLLMRDLWMMYFGQLETAGRMVYINYKLNIVIYVSTMG